MRFHYNAIVCGLLFLHSFALYSNLILQKYFRLSLEEPQNLLSNALFEPHLNLKLENKKIKKRPLLFDCSSVRLYVVALFQSD